jgi:uncharacterized iron-regulated protein
MKNPPLFLLLWILTSSVAWSQTKTQTKLMRDNPAAYALYHGDGSPAKWTDLVAEAAGADVVCFGELHDDAVMHWLEQELVRDLLAQGTIPNLGAEMFEADDQLVVDEYLAGVVNLDKLEAAANLWHNHATDYHPLLDLAKEHGLTMTATNVPRRYASWVYKHGLNGLEDLSADARAYLPSLPVAYDPTLPGYEAMLAMAGGHGGETLPMAQAIKDATMAHWILQTRTEGQPFVHVNGSYHSQDWEGIVWHLRHANPELNVLTLHGETQVNVWVPDSSALNRADFLLLTQAQMTRTH